jgi:hypothetical protein
MIGFVACGWSGCGTGWGDLYDWTCLNEMLGRTADSWGYWTKTTSDALYNGVTSNLIVGDAQCDPLKAHMAGTVTVSLVDREETDKQGKPVTNQYVEVSVDSGCSITDLQVYVSNSPDGLVSKGKSTWYKLGDTISGSKLITQKLSGEYPLDGEVYLAVHGYTCCENVP